MIEFTYIISNNTIRNTFFLFLRLNSMQMITSSIAIDQWYNNKITTKSFSQFEFEGGHRNI